MRKNKQVFLFFFGLLGGIFFLINHQASKYDFELTDILTPTLPFELNVKWYEANYQIVEIETQKGIMLAKHYFPFNDDKNGVYVDKILKYCKVGEFLAVYVKTVGKIEVIVIKNYDIEFSRPQFEVLEPKAFMEKYGQLNKCVDLNDIPMVMGLWPIIGSILLMALAVLFYLIIKE